MPTPVEHTLTEADSLAREGRIDQMFEALRALSIDEFATLMWEPPPGYSNLAAALPPMAPAEVQISMTGKHGELMRLVSVEFTQILEMAFRQHAGRDLTGARILDFGCGWGRMIRMMYRFTPPARLFGVDAWQESLAHCAACRLFGNFAQSDSMPRKLPFGRQRFDLIYSYSVFTHLSPKTADIAQTTLRQRLAKNGLLVATVRPATYWEWAHQEWGLGQTASDMVRRHNEDGIAYIPHLRPPTEGELTYGDTTIAESYVARDWTGWDLVGSQVMENDSLQIALFLKPRPRRFFLF